MRKALLSLLLTLAVTNLNAQSSSSQPKPCSTPEYRMLDYWVGDWDVFNPKGVQAGTSHVESILNGCVVLENWTGAKGGAGKSFNRWNSETKQWEQHWVDNSGSEIRFNSHVQDGNIIYEREYDQAGKHVQERMALLKSDANTVRQLWESSTDGGKTWAPQFDGKYVRRK